MFRKLCLAAFTIPLASALVLQIPENPTSQGTVTIKWTQEPNDPATFSIELINKAFNNAFAIANNVNPTQQFITLTLPVVPVGDGYTLEAVNIGDINNVFSTTGTFSIGASTTTVSSSVPSTSVSSTASNTRSTSGSGIVTTVSVVRSSVTNSPGVSTNINTPTTTGTTSVSSTAPPSSSSSGASSFNGQSGGALSSRMGAGSIAALLVSLAAGAAAVVF